MIYRDSLGRFKAIAPNLNMSPELAYIIGVVWGDGYINKYPSDKYGYGYTIALDTIDRDFASEFANCLSSIRLNPKIYSRKTRNSYIAKARSIKLFQFFEQLTLDKARNLLNHASNKIKIFFVKGFSDSEGSVAFLCTGQIQISMSNKNRELLTLIRDLLLNLDMETTIAKGGFTAKGENKYALLIRTKSHRKFSQLIGSSIQRKSIRLLEVA